MNYKLSGLSPDKKTLLDEGKLLPLMEEFYTIQGEGFNTGKASYFIRIGGCDVGCHWCDVKESWDASIHPLTPTELIVDHVMDSNTPAVVVTGGEPLIYNLTHLTTLLKKQQIKTYIETSGAYSLSGDWDWICLSPKKTMLPKQENYLAAHELKIIVFNKHDGVQSRLWVADAAQFEPTLRALIAATDQPCQPLQARHCHGQCSHQRLCTCTHTRMHAYRPCSTHTT